MSDIDGSGAGVTSVDVDMETPLIDWGESRVAREGAWYESREL